MPPEKEMKNRKHTHMRSPKQLTAFVWLPDGVEVRARTYTRSAAAAVKIRIFSLLDLFH